MIYPAMTYIGSNRFSALYGQTDTIIDQKATGLQHLYVDNYEFDLIHTACSTVKLNNTLYYSDREKPEVGHPKRHKPVRSYTIDNAIMVDEFQYEDFTKVDYVGAHEEYIRFKSTITNTSKESKKFQLSSLLISNPNHRSLCTQENGFIHYEIKRKHIAMFSSKYEGAHMSLDAPSGFMYRGIDDLLFDNNNVNNKTMDSSLPIASSLYVNEIIKPNESKSFEWIILIGESKEDLLKKYKTFHFVPELEDITIYWKDYLKDITIPQEYVEETKTKLVALKGALLDGLLPADLTGHYFANGEVCFYSRDALMGSRAFLYAGLYKDFESIIQFFMSCEVKENGEYYQRYRFDKIADEGANNNVYNQIDFIGYFTRVITDYYHLTGVLLCSFDSLNDIISLLSLTQSKQGLYGPEGGVNEGVYGPAFITSTNMFIAGGLKGVIELARESNHLELEQKWNVIYEGLYKAIERIFSTQKYYPYGYVTYHNDVIKRYDTPQLLAGSLGYPLTAHFKESFVTLIQKATYYKHGIGYSEQEYHNGPWIFNTAAAAQVAYLLQDFETYRNTMEWLINHQNGFGMNPEAIDAANESIPFINPLMWANSEFVCASYANVIQSIRRKS
jgi:hypothetical protein